MFLPVIVNISIRCSVQFHQEGIVVYGVIIRFNIGFAEEPVLRIVFQYFIDRTF